MRKLFFIQISLQFVPNGPTDDNPGSIQITNDGLVYYICVTQLGWVNDILMLEWNQQNFADIFKYNFFNDNYCNKMHFMVLYTKCYSFCQAINVWNQTKQCLTLNLEQNDHYSSVNSVLVHHKAPTNRLFVQKHVKANNTEIDTAKNKVYGSGHEICGCLVTWFCYQLIAKPGNKTATVTWPDPYPCGFPTQRARNVESISMTWLQHVPCNK